MPMTAGRLKSAVSAVCPVASTSVGDAYARATWSFIPGTNATQPEIDAGNNVVATIPADGEGVLTNFDFIARFTDDEYALLWETRNGTGVSKSGADGSLGKLWDQTIIATYVNMNKKLTQDLKSALVTAGVLTQARADEIFKVTMDAKDRARGVYSLE